MGDTGRVAGFEEEGRGGVYTKGPATIQIECADSALENPQIVSIQRVELS